MSVLLEMTNQSGEVIGYIFDCPGCERSHAVYVKEKNPLGAIWSFNGNMDRPTFSPSLLQRVKWSVPQKGRTEEVCHLFVKDGVCEFCGDSTHALAGKSAPLRAII